MREFSKVSPALWGSERFTALPSDDARFVYLYLLTCEHQTSAGAFKLKDGYATDDLKWEASRYHTARQQLVQADLIHLDETASVILITRWFKHNPPMNESHFRGIAKVIQKLPSITLASEAQVELQQAFDAVQLARATAKAAAGMSDLSPAMKAKAGNWRV